MIVAVVVSAAGIAMIKGFEILTFIANVLSVADVSVFLFFVCFCFCFVCFLFLEGVGWGGGLGALVCTNCNYFNVFVF